MPDSGSGALPGRQLSPTVRQRQRARHYRRLFLSSGWLTRSPLVSSARFPSDHVRSRNRSPPCSVVSVGTTPDVPPIFPHGQISDRRSLSIGLRRESADLLGEPRPELARHVVAHAREAMELRARDRLRQGPSPAGMDERVIRAVYDKRGYVEPAQQLGAVRLGQDGVELPEIATGVVPAVETARRDVADPLLIKRIDLRADG